jgi:hypothetical protein
MSGVSEKDLDLGKIEELLHKQMKDSTIAVSDIKVQGGGTPSESVKIYGKMLLKDVLDFNFTATMPAARIVKKLLDK